MDYLILLQAVVYHCIFVSGFFVSLSVAIIRAKFGGICILYAEVRRGYIHSGSSSLCDFPIYFGVVGMIIHGFLAGAVFMYFANKSRKGEYVGERMWTLPVITLNAALAFVSMVNACVLTVGFKVFCGSLHKSSSNCGCLGYKHVRLSTGTEVEPFVGLSCLSETGAWAGFLLYMIQTGLSAIRMYRNRLRQK